MSISLFKSPTTVLTISDEALYVHVAGMRSVKLVEVVSWDAPDFVNTLANILIKDCKRKPILFLNDMVEQHYRKERVPRVGTMDKANVVRRRLQVAFPSYPIRAAMQMKEKAQKNKDGRAGDIFIFAAVPKTEGFEKAMEAAKKSMCPIVGYALLPVESSDMVRTLAARLSARGKKKTVWSLFMGQHENGGLRQIVTKNGELALTRMTPVSLSDAEPAQAANELLQEFRATMSYLSRFGFTPEDGLDIIAITTPQTGEMLGEMLDDTYSFYPLGVREAAKYIGVNVGMQVDQKYADALHIGWAAKKSRLTLPMSAREIEEVSRPRQVAMLATLLLLVGAGAQGYMFLDTFQAVQTLENDIGDVQRRQNDLNQTYQQEVAKKEALGFDIRLVQAATEVHGQLEAQEIPSLNLVNALGRALGRDLRMDQMTVELGRTNTVTRFISNENGDEQAAPTPPGYEVSFQMTFPSTTDIDRGNQEVSDLRDRLAVLLPDHEVEVDKYLKDYEFVDELVVETGNVNEAEVSQDFIAAIKIKGPKS